MIDVPERIIIVGGSLGRDQARKAKNERSQVWCVARIYDKVPYADYVFDMHTSHEQWTHNTYTAYDHSKLVLRQPHTDFPFARLMPTKDLLEEFGPVFTSSFSWLTAYAIYCGARHLSYYGVNMMHDSELGKQRDGLIFLLGFARARGIRIDTPQRSYLRHGVKL